MKKTILLLLLFSNLAFSQSKEVNALLHKISTEKNKNKRVALVISFFSNTTDKNPLLDLKNAQEIVYQSKKDNDTVIEAVAASQVAIDYRQLGNTIKSLDLNIKANALAEKTGNPLGIAFSKAMLAINYKDLENYAESIRLNLAAEKLATKVKNPEILESVYKNLASVYIFTENSEAALSYAQKDYELCTQYRLNGFLSITFANFGFIQGKLGNNALANNYFDMAIKEAVKIKSPKQIVRSYTAKADYFQSINKIDSCVANAKKGIVAVKNTEFSDFSIKPAKLLLDIYENTNSDSAIKYFKIYRTANENLFSAKTLQQTQLLTAENTMHQKELAEEKLKIEEQNKEDMQYIIIAIGILTLIIIYLLLSRSFITNTKLIEFFGVIALLILFEFLNLLLHPFLEKITHHSPILMLLSLVSIAALLVPLHHKVEHWTTAKLIEKNKQIRLANAKKTIKKLESE
jgi:tetratricopeptide (TPR) repeat protein